MGTGWQKGDTMIESEWMQCTDPQLMMSSQGPLSRPLSPRKQTLFAVACCRRIWQMLPDDSCRMAIELAERLADGLATKEEWEVAREAPSRIGWDEDGMEYANHAAAAASLAGEGHDADLVAGLATAASNREDEPSRQASLLRCIFGNPFHHVTIDPTWLSWNDHA